MSHNVPIVEDSGALPRKILSDITVFLKYAKYNDNLKRRESYDELVDRNRDMHIKKYPQLEANIRDVYEKFVRTKKVLPSMRSFQFAGRAIEANPARIFNCACGSADDPYFYAEAMQLLLGGTGLGYLVTQEVVAKLPPIYSPIKGKYKKRYLVEDSIQGWSMAVEMLVNSYFYKKRELEFDFSSIRPKGARLITAGGHAPGYFPLSQSLNKIKEVFEEVLSKRGEGAHLKPIEVHDQLCYIADAVLAGGIRRCLPMGTKVFTVNGPISIEDIQIGDLVYTSSGELEPVNNTFVQGTQNISEVYTDLGVFKATKNHRMAVLGPAGGYVWKQVSELSEQDQLIFFTDIIEGVSQQLPEDFTNARPERSTTCVDITIPELDEDMAWFLGFFHGNGHVYNRNTKKLLSKGGSSVITVTTDTKNIGFIEKVTSQIARFGVKTRTLKRPNENTNEVLASSQRLAEYFEKYIKRSSTTIRVPSFISLATEEIRGAYLAGVIDSDGCILNRPVKAVTTVYPEFAQDIQSLYASFGIPTKIRITPRKEENWKTLHEVSIIGFREKYNTYVGEYSLKGTLPINKPSKGFSVPNSVVKSVLSRKEYRKLWTGTGSMNYERALSFESLKDIIPGVPINILKVALDTEEVPTYDIEVDNAHEFYANGFLTHNSAMISGFSPEDEDMITCKSGNWWEQNPQRARANNSVVLVRSKTSREQFDNLWDKVKASNAGEPGFYWTNDENNEYFTNPCCLVDSTPLLTSAGLVAIGDLASLGEEHSIINAHGDECIARVWSTGIKPTFSILLETGATISATSDHRFMLSDGSEETLQNLEGKELLTLNGKSIKVISMVPQGDQEVFDFSLHGGLPWGSTVEGVIVHNCEISLKANGGFCNLTEINSSDIVSQEDLDERAIAGAFIGTLQAGFTNFHFLREQWRINAEEEALLGVSMTGIASMEVFKYNIERSSKLMVEENKRVARLININPAKRIGTVKPSGTTSLVLGTSSGIHAYHDEYYIRRIRIDKNESLYKYLSTFHPELVEDEYFAPNKTAVISIPQKAPEGAVLRSESPFDLLSRVKKIKAKWIDPSHQEGVNTHNVSVTVSIQDDQWDSVGAWMWENKDVYNGISVLNYSTGSYKQTPFETCSKEVYEELVKKLQDVDLTLVLEEDDETDLQGEQACAAGNCEVV